jgi:hypothetical protein
MAYTTIDFKTKKALKDAVKSGKVCTVYQPGGLFPDPPYPGSCCVEGPHTPKPHTWYARVVLDETGKIVKVD